MKKKNFDNLYNRSFESMWNTTSRNDEREEDLENYIGFCNRRIDKKGAVMGTMAY